MPASPDEPASPGEEPSTLANAAVSVDPGDLEVLNPRVRFVWIAQALLTAVVLGAVAGAIAWYVDYPYLAIGAGVLAVAAVLGVIHAVLRYRIWGFRIREDSLYLRRGVLIRIQTVVPYVRIQHVDTRRSPIERLVGLSSSVIYTAGSRGADVSIPGLRPERARELQERLKTLANVTGRDDAV